MENINWLKQQPDKPLFPDLLWSRPENKAQAGKLLIIGGNKFGFSAPGAAFAASEKAGIGTVRVLLPDSLKKTIGGLLAADFAPSTPIGSFSRQALAEVMELAGWADGILLAGDFGRNSETAVMLESLVQKYKGPLVVSEDGLDYFLNKSSSVLARPKTALVINLGKLQKLAKSSRPSTPVLHNMNLVQLASVMEDWSNSIPAALVTKHNDNFAVANEGKVSTTPSTKEDIWQTELAAYASVWLLQNPDKPFEALTCAAYDYLNA